ncbi:hypothetical protein R1sor_026831 [Riccia sorocarpa]|uniref:Uncharacterized protein n=1 Tax=Riccia sorocarpa TaxID=122646 RepID=A0ABD3GD84_9MARC
MRQTGHRDPVSYGKYDQTDKRLKDQAAQQIISGEMKDEKRLTYEEAYQEELAKYELVKNAVSGAVETASVVVAGRESGTSNLLQSCNTTIQNVGGTADTAVVAKEQPSHVVIQEEVVFTAATSNASSAASSSATSNTASENQFVEFNEYQRILQFQEFKKFRGFQDYFSFKKFN